MNSGKYDVIVIGAGISGLLSALVLSKHGNRVLVLEKNDCVGGNCRTYNVDGFMVDTGPHAVTMLRGGPLCMLMDQYFDKVPDFIRYGDYYIRSAETKELVRCPTNVHDFMTFDFLPLKDRILLSSAIISAFTRMSAGKDYSKISVYDALPKSLSSNAFAFADAFSKFMSGRGMKETSVRRMAAGSTFSSEKKMTRDEFDALVNGIIMHDDVSGTPSASKKEVIGKLLYHKGGFSNQGYPVGGIGSILTCLLESLPENVEIRTGCRVRRIFSENGSVRGAEFFTDPLSGVTESAYADLIVYTGFAANLIKMLEELPAEYGGRLRKIDHTISITSWAGLDEKIPALSYIGSEVRYEEMPYWGGPMSNYDPGLAIPGGQLAGFCFVPNPRKNIRGQIDRTFDTLFDSIPGLEDHVVMKHAQITVPEKAAITINGEFADVRTPVKGLYMAGTDTDKRSMGITRAAYSVIDLMEALEKDGRFPRKNSFGGYGNHRAYLPADIAGE